ncbi:MAG: CpaF family protein, partial [Firmicutes bacterium]|nr:CpaF family protein [Bacillota bacterium]
MRKEWKRNRPEISVLELAEEVRSQYSLSDNISDADVEQLCRKCIEHKPELFFMTENEKNRLSRLVFCSLRCELEILQDLADDPDISEIMVNGKDDIFYEKKG